ncbi:DUF3159 domain-containing protein [Corynebacterium epidermidicanis]|uniref:Putative DUF3159 family protein n=1 Tax=Corynebacterium epidermidicanis TaxID=1050174 RepID=A0A0G3GWT4_9CORY|nr:putative DUF3159 family protein [Corynebacterium epidermidicanis]
MTEIQAMEEDSAAVSEPNTETSAHNKAEPTMWEQMGGISGLVSSTLPILVLVPVNNRFGLSTALLAALGVAIALFAWRIVRKENLQPAVSGLIGVGIGAGIAYFTGSAKGYFLYGIWVSLLLGIAFLASIVVRWPAVGVIWRGINGESMDWRNHKSVLRWYDMATAAWAVVFFARFIVQNNFYNADSTDALAIARIAMGWPLTGLVTLLTIVLVRKANAQQEQLEAEDVHS